jgi:hypothetical protein
MPASTTCQPLPEGLAMHTSFERHGIDHLSASSLNLWAAEPALWVMERLLDRRSPTSAVAARGKAVEHGIHVGLVDAGREVAACIAAAEAAFDREMALTPDGRRDAERGNLAGYVQHGLAELRQYGSPTAYQDRVEIALDDVPVPLVGYPDWRFDQHGLIVDLKTAERLPSAISNSHGRQGAVYARAHGNYGMRMAYVKPSAGRDGRAVAVYEMSADEVRAHLAALRQIALRLERFMAVSSDPAELAGMVVPDYDAFWWNRPITRAHGTAVFGF